VKFSGLYIFSAQLLLLLHLFYLKDYDFESVTEELASDFPQGSKSAAVLLLLFL